MGMRVIIEVRRGLVVGVWASEKGTSVDIIDQDELRDYREQHAMAPLVEEQKKLHRVWG